jgi:hypothetical protein
MGLVRLLLVWVLLLASPVSAQAQRDDGANASPPVQTEQPGDNGLEEELGEGGIPDVVLAWMIENPFSGVVRTGVFNSTAFGVPPNDRVGNAFLLAPILPVLFQGGWSLISRLVVPAVVTVPVGNDRVTGFGDMSYELLGHKLFRSRRKLHLYDVALGGIVGFPTATDDFLGSKRWELGPSAFLGIGTQHVVTLLLMRNIWSVDRSSRPDVNQLSFNYFLFFNLPRLFYLVYEPLIRADWTAQRGDRWTLPVGVGFGKNFRIPRRPRLAMAARVSGFYNAVRTDRDAKWQLLFVFNFIKPNPAVFTTLAGAAPR